MFKKGMRILPHYNEINLQKRLLVCFLTVCLLFVLLIGRLSVVQLVQGNALSAKAAAQWMRGLPIQAPRGKFLDVNSVVLAENATTYNIYVRASNVLEPERVARVLSDTLSLRYEEMLLKAKNRKISESLIQMQVEEKLARKIINANLAGIYLSQNMKRTYPFGDFLTQVLGYTTIDSIGQAGLEVFYNQYLSGVNGKSLLEGDARGKELVNTGGYYIPAIPGLDVMLTIDSQVQLILEEVLEQIMLEQKAKATQGIIMNAKTGEIVAMSSKPSFNLNTPMRSDLATLNSLSKNVSIVDVYEPGSTFKLFTTAAALEEKLTEFEDTFYDPGYRIVDGQRIKCWRTIGHGHQTLVEAVANSCNSVFMDLGLRLGTSKLYQYLRGFGMGTKTGIDFFSETNGLLLNEKSVKTVDLARISFGHTVAVSALQLVAGVAAVINGGTLVQPHFIKQVSQNSDQGGKTIYKAPNITVRRVISEKTSSEMRFMMENVVARQNGINAFVPGYVIGGKTGTAQKYASDGHIAQGKYVSSFTGYAGVGNQQYVLLILVDEPGAGAYYGSIVAAPYGRAVFEQIFQTKNILPGKQADAEIQAMQKNIRLPSFVGMTLSDALAKVKRLGLQAEIDGEGGMVVWQYEPEGTMMFKNGIVLLKTDGVL